MDCLEVKNQLMEFADNELPERELEAVRLHLNRCLDCSQKYQLLLDITRGIAQLPHYEPSSQFNNKVLAALGINAARTTTVSAWLRWAIRLSVMVIAGWVSILIFVLFPRTAPFIHQLAAKYIDHPLKGLLMFERYLWHLIYAVNDIFIVAINTIIPVLLTPRIAAQFIIVSFAAIVLIKLIFNLSFSQRTSVAMKGVAS